MKRDSGCCAVDDLLHSSLNLIFRQRKSHNTFIFGMAYLLNLAWSRLQQIEVHRKTMRDKNTINNGSACSVWFLSTTGLCPPRLKMLEHETQSSALTFSLSARNNPGVHHKIFIISQRWLTSHPRSTVVLLDTGTTGTSREIYSEFSVLRTQY